MEANHFTPRDIEQIEAQGLTMKIVQGQIEQFKMPPAYLKILRPCTPGDGIKVLREDEIETLIETYSSEAAEGRCLKFVPSSGAASRMFKSLLRHLNKKNEILLGDVIKKGQKGDKDARELLKFMEGIRRFAFFQDLEAELSRNGFSMETLLRKGQITEIIRLLLLSEGLDYANLPKALLKFHRYDGKSRTAFEEHLVEAASLIADQNGICRIHFTVSPEHLDQFRALLENVKAHYEEHYNVSLQVAFSTQRSTTDTIAVDLNDRPFRQKNGQLLFRPGGHGALIENLNDLQGDIIFIKNIDNIVPDRLRNQTSYWKKALGGYLLTIQNHIFKSLGKLHSGNTNQAFFDNLTRFMRDELSVEDFNSAHDGPVEAKRRYFIDKLNRPVRVCGMVKNEGEPGGGPFWVADESGVPSLQIVEHSQINPNSREQQEIWASSSHFNPVDLVCGVRDWQGRSFDLKSYVDPRTVLIARKSKDGRELKSIEHPGLWNGAMASWITVFVEVPIITFNPVKTVNDLLRKEHQPE